MSDLPGGDRAAAAARRLRTLRQQRGFRNSKTAAEAISGEMGVSLNPTTYSHHEFGHRTITVEAAELYGSFYGVSASAILFGPEPSAANAPIPFFGEVLSNGMITLAEGSQETAPGLAADSGDIVALRVGTADLYPAYRNRDYVYFHRQVFEGPLNPSLITRRECIVALPDNRVLLRYVTQETGGKFTLSRYRQAAATGVTLVRAAPIIWVYHSPPE